MSGETIVRLAAAMEADPDAGIVQSLPLIVNRNTFFARLQQFAARIAGPVLACGLAAWMGRDGNYWGHNAIIRTRAFAEQAGLPHLRGRKPFGGHVMSHDFVEAALLRRGGWAVHMVPGLRGSYEEGPPSLSDVLVRDRRWCQGNLQHAAVLTARRLHWNSRLHLLTGIGSYVTAPMWLMFLVIGVLISLQARFIPPDYFPSGPSLFPQWPIQDPVRSMWVFIGTMGILLAPKLFSWIALLADRTTRRGCGGMIRVFIGIIVETVVGGLIAPVTMLSQSAAVVAIMIGRDSGWRPQRRDDGGILFREIVRGYWATTVFGLLLGVASYLVAPPLLLWMSPVVLGLSLAIPLAAVTSRADVGRAIRRAGMLRIPEEREPPEVLARARILTAELRWSEEAPADGLGRFLRDKRLVAAHRRMLPPPRRRGDPIDAVLLVGLAKLAEAETLVAATGALTTAELAAVLGDPGGIDRLVALAHEAGAR
jgi:membrane glycosyltransferase